jgi:hypothetical protein
VSVPELSLPQVDPPPLELQPLLEVQPLPEPPKLTLP